MGKKSRSETRTRSVSPEELTVGSSSQSQETSTGITSDELPRLGSSLRYNSNRRSRPDINLLSLRWADEQQQPLEDDRRTCAATDATSDAGGHDLDGFDNVGIDVVDVLTEGEGEGEVSDDGGESDSHGGMRSPENSERGLTCAATHASSETAKAADLDEEDFRGTYDEDRHPDNDSEGGYVGNRGRRSNRRPEINLLSLEWAAQQNQQDDDRRTCAATDATSDAGWHDLEGFENEIEHAGSEENEYDYDRMRGMGGRSTQGNLTSAATNDTSEAGKTDELDDFEEEEEDIDSLGALIGRRRPSSGAASGANTCDEDDCTTHAFASESGCIGDLRGFYDEDEEAERGKGIVGQTYLAVRDTVEYINTMLYFYQGGSYANNPYFRSKTYAKVHCFARAVPYLLWNKPHYRHDLAKNLRNVALPGTGVPLSYMCLSRTFFAACALLIPPAYSMVSAIFTKLRSEGVTAVLRQYRDNLLSPTDWFSLWASNCSLSSLHSHVTRDPGYGIEDKYMFLEEARMLGLPCTPMLHDNFVVVKHRNEEGGLGYKSFSNAAGGGEWIIQPGLRNSKKIAQMLPLNAPLSTLRIVSSCAGGGAGGSLVACVWRAGRAGAATDHKSVLFDVDSTTGEVKGGATSGRWYMTGFFGAIRSLLRRDGETAHDIDKHPDTGVRIKGMRMPDFARIRDTVSEAHAKMAPGVPLIGWDVGMTDKGILLLEANLSCNFFRGSYDRERHHAFLDEHFSALSAQLSS